MKISIKESGRYANFLNNKILEISNIPYNSINSRLEKVTELHKKSNANPEAKDETLIIEHNDIYDVSPENALEVLAEIIEEKAKLAIAISNAKASNLVEVDDKEMNIDVAIEYSKLIRAVALNFFHPLLSRKDKFSKERGTAYAFNVEGEQVSYVYEVEKRTELKYDKNIFVKEQKKLLLLADKTSVMIDKIMNLDIVDFDPKYNYLDSTEDILCNE